MLSNQAALAVSSRIFAKSCTKGGPGWIRACEPGPVHILCQGNGTCYMGVLGQVPWCEQPELVVWFIPVPLTVSIVLEPRQCRVLVMGLVANSIHGADKPDNNVQGNHGN